MAASASKAAQAARAVNIRRKPLFRSSILTALNIPDEPPLYDLQ
jgi:hypothetical protein